MTYLLDVNVIIALLDADHLKHERAFAWYNRAGQRSWATSPIVQNGVIRIMGGQGYTNFAFGCDAVAGALDRWCRLPEHQFWPDDVSLLGNAAVDLAQLTSPSRITDTYLLALAVSRGGTLATLNRKLSPAGVRGGREALFFID